ncbi:MAG: CvpA family protein [Planctomycetota bacterium]|jgi:hypothetical protein
MVFWASILAGGFFAWLAIRMGFYETWTMLFNIVISVYTAVFLAPAIADIAPAAGDTAYGTALSLAVTATGVFLILHGISYVFLTGQFKVSFAKVFDLVLAGVLGFLAGCLVFSFAAFVIAATPISQNSVANRLGFNGRSQRSNMAYICWWCDAVDLVASSPGRTTTSKQILDELLGSAQWETKDEAEEQTEPNEPPMAESESQTSAS